MSDESDTFQKLAAFIAKTTKMSKTQSEELLHYIPHIALVLHLVMTCTVASLLGLKQDSLIPMKAEVGKLFTAMLNQYPLNVVRPKIGLADEQNSALVMAAISAAAIYALCSTRKAALYAALWDLSLVVLAAYTLYTAGAEISKPLFWASQVRYALLLLAALYVINHKDQALCFYLDHLRTPPPPRKSASSPRKSASPKKEEAGEVMPGSPKSKTRDASPAPTATAKKSAKKSASPKK